MLSAFCAKAVAQMMKKHAAVMVITFWVIFINLIYSFSALLPARTRACPPSLARRRVHIDALVLIPSTGFKENFLRFSGTLTTNSESLREQVDTNRHKDGGSQTTTDDTDFARSALECGATAPLLSLGHQACNYRFSKKSQRTQRAQKIRRNE